MKGTKKPRLALTVLLFLVGETACQDAAPSEPASSGTWQVQDGFLRAPDGRAAIFRGANASGQQKGPPYLDASSADDYRKLRTVFGMNAIRFVMTWAAVEPMPGHYDDAYLDAVATRIGWAEAANLSVILDMHEDVYGEGFGFDGAPRWACDASHYRAFMPREPWFVNSLDPNVQACVDAFFTDAETQKHFVAAWRHVAERLANAPAVVGFDVLNEPNWGTYALSSFEPDRLTPFYVQVVKEVRVAAPHWVAFLEPSATRNLGLATGLTRFPFENVVYAPHSYDTSAESGGGFDPAHRENVLDNFAALAEEAHALDAGLWIGEYGGMIKSPGYADYMRAEYDGAGAVAAGTMYWDHSRGGSYSMLDEGGTPRKEAVAALLRPYPERTAGTPRSYSFDAASSSFVFRYKSASRAPAVSDLVVPDALYASGYHVACNGCTLEKSIDHLRITDSVLDAELQLIVSP